MVNCCVCKRERESFKSLTLTAEEKRIVTRSTGKPCPDTVDYCKSCWAISTNRVQGAQLFKGMLQLHLRTSGVRNSEQVATKVQTKLVEKASKKPVS